MRCPAPDGQADGPLPEVGRRTGRPAGTDRSGWHGPSDRVVRGAEGGDRDTSGAAGAPAFRWCAALQWLRCAECNELASAEGDTFTFVNDNPTAPHEAKFRHDCRSKKPLAVAARYTLVCPDGHLDEFPYREFAHNGGACPKYQRPKLHMIDSGGNQAANVMIKCVTCDASNNMQKVVGERGRRANLPRCRGRHPHLNTFVPGGCDKGPTLTVAGAPTTGSR